MYCCDCTSQGLEVSGQCIAAPQSPESLLYTSYKQKSDEFRKLFKEVPESEKLIAGETDREIQRDKKQINNVKIYSTANVWWQSHNICILDVVWMIFFSLDYTCALQKDILLQGRIYLTENCLCFYSQVFRGTKVSSTEKLYYIFTVPLKCCYLSIAKIQFIW